jgi:3'-phosphoadenosine 5'-phosphosulfate sulfotransferase (PAPS reductase)/FAD synthetase
MNLFENTQTTLEEKVEKSKRFIQKVINSKDKDFTSKLILGFSGGKDSCVVYDLVMDIDNSIPCYYANTTIDPKGTVPYIRNNFPNVEILNPKESLPSYILEKHYNRKHGKEAYYGQK